MRRTDPGTAATWAGYRWWWLPLVIAVVPFVVTHAALVISIERGYVPACVPYLDGCTSISRAARHGLANTLFQWVMVPMAAVHVANWWLVAGHLRRHLAGSRAVAALWPLGLVAGLALATYAVALGTEGDFYRWMRRFGIIFYFGCTYLAQLAFQSAWRRVDPNRSRAVEAMRAVLLVLLMMGLASTAVTHAVPEEDFKNTIENVLEWHLGLLMTAWFALQASVLRRGPSVDRAGGRSPA
jgi:hypothetical protein